MKIENLLNLHMPPETRAALVGAELEALIAYVKKHDRQLAEWMNNVFYRPQVGNHIKGVGVQAPSVEAFKRNLARLRVLVEKMNKERKDVDTRNADGG